MRVKGITVEDFVNYKLPSLFIGSCFCNWKCCNEQGLDISVCQNQSLAQAPIIDMADEDIYEMYVSNPITQAVVIGGLEPMQQFDELINLISRFRHNGEMCPFVIYTGYEPCEIPLKIKCLKALPNIIIKFGRYALNNKPHYDDVLGVKLASDNQYGEVIS